MNRSAKTFFQRRSHPSIYGFCFFHIHSTGFYLFTSTFTWMEQMLLFCFCLNKMKWNNRRKIAYPGEWSWINRSPANGRETKEKGQLRGSSRKKKGESIQLYFAFILLFYSNFDLEWRKGKTKIVAIMKATMNFKCVKSIGTAPIKRTNSIHVDWGWEAFIFFAFAKVSLFVFQRLSFIHSWRGRWKSFWTIAFHHTLDLVFPVLND